MTSGWPATEHVPRPWRTNPDQRGPNGARPPKADRLLSEVIVEVPAEIADLALSLSAETVVGCEEAVRAITQTDSKGAALRGVSDVLVRTEAVASSKIEKVYAELDEIAKASVGAEVGGGARATLAATAAVRDLVDAAGSGAICEDDVKATQGRLLRDDVFEGRESGAYRTMQNWIGGSDHTPLRAVHIPPPAADVPRLMADLISFANRRDISALAQAAITHAQFEAIHPFTDGNGRVGRALLGAVLRVRGVTQAVTVPIAAVMLADVDEYFDQLKLYRDGDVDTFVQYAAAAAATAATAAEVSADRLGELPAKWREQVSPRAGSAAAKLVDSLLAHPIIDLSIGVALTGVGPGKALRGIDRLAEAGLLREITGGSRNRIWVCDDVMDEVAELEQRIGLRSKPGRRWR